MSDPDRDTRYETPNTTPSWVYPDERLPIDPDLDPADPGEPSAQPHPIPHARRARQPAVLAAIAVGGFIGALGRYQLLLAWNVGSGHLPWATFAINTSGAFLLGVIQTVLLRRARPTTVLRPFLCVGVLGAWTTMSAFAVETDLLIKDGHFAVAVGYVALTVITGLAVSWVGMVAGRALVTRKPARWA